MVFILMIDHVIVILTTREEENKIAGVSCSAIRASPLPGISVAVFGCTADTITISLLGL